MLSEDKTCSNCAWWCQRGAQIAKAILDPSASEGVGTCQINPPETVKIVGGWVEAVFPVTHASRFCGMWEPEGGPEPEGGEEISTGEVVTLRRAA